MTGVTAVVPHWNRKEMLLTLLAGLRRQTVPFDEILVVDNGSTDGSAEAAEASGARVIRVGYNSGFAAAVNRGVAACDTDWVAVLNNDIDPEPNWLESLMAAAAESPAKFFTGKLLRSGNPGILDGSYDLVSRACCAWRAGNGRPDGPLWSEPRAISCAPFTAALFRRDLFAELGPLDEEFGSYLEDVDFGLRCATAGHSGLYVPQAVARHHGSGTLGEWSPETVRLIARNQLLLIAKHTPGIRSWPVLAGQLLWGLLALRHGVFVPYLKGKAEGLRTSRIRQIQDSGPVREKLRLFFRDSERQILALQRETGFDLYWRLYFALTRAGR